MRFVRVLAFCVIIMVVHAGLFGNDPDVERRRKRQEDQKNKRNNKQGQNRKKPPKQDPKDEDEPIKPLEIKEILSDPENIDTVTAQDNPKLKNDEIYSLWEQNMHDFVPEDLTNFLIDASSATVLYEDINHERPTTIKGAYYVHGGSDARPVNVFVQDPAKNIIYKRTEEIQGIMIFDTTVPGQYAIIFSNLDDGHEKTVTLAIHTYEEKDDEVQFDINNDGERIVKYDPKGNAQTNMGTATTGKSQEFEEELNLAGDKEIGDVRNILRGIQTASKQIQTEAVMSLNRQDSHNSDTIDNGNWYYWAMLIELLLFMSILGFQSYHMKAKLDSKLVL